MKASEVKKDLEKYKSVKAELLQRFFKTGPGEYGQGDVFLGVSVPDQRKIAKKYVGMSLKQIQILLNSKIHEHRLVGLLILLGNYPKDKDNVYRFYLNNTKNINNWDLVDLTAHKIVGDYLLDKDRKILYKLAKSKSLWERRISVIATFAFIYNNDL